MPEKGDEQQEIEKECKSPPSKLKAKPTQSIDQFKRLMALIEINQRAGEQQRETIRKVMSRLSLLE